MMEISSPTYNLEDHPLSAVSNGIFNIFAAGSLLLHPYLKDAPLRGDRGPLISVKVSSPVRSYGVTAIRVPDGSRQNFH
jgi:hypothetical protein